MRDGRSSHPLIAFSNLSHGDRSFLRAGLCTKSSSLRRRTVCRFDHTRRWNYCSRPWTTNGMTDSVKISEHWKPVQNPNRSHQGSISLFEIPARGGISSFSLLSADLDTVIVVFAGRILHRSSFLIRPVMRRFYHIRIME